MTEHPAVRLLQCVLEGGRGSSRLSVVGLSKNAGKTVTLNHIIRAASTQAIPLGLISTGRDGEEQDAITELPKPRIQAPAGAWIATARQALAAATAEVEPLQELPFRTPFGPIVVGRTRTDGEVLLIGPGSVRRIGELLSALEARGARLCLVDGSFDRMAVAAPTVTGRVVLAAGAAYSTSMTQTLAQVRFVLDVFDLPPVPPPLTEAVTQAARTGPVSIVTRDGAITPVPVLSALSDPETIGDAALARTDREPHLVLDGALSDRLLHTLIRRRAASIPLIVSDPTHILVDRNTWRRWRRQGGQAYVRHPVKLVAVTTNPYSPVGQDYDAEAFFREVCSIAHRPVFDLQAGLSHPL